MNHVGRFARRAGWGVADQALSSLTNFGLSFLVARQVSARDFGAFGIVLVTYWAALGLVRALSSQPLVIRFAGVLEREWRTATSDGTGAALVVGAVCGAICAGAGVISSGVLGEALLGLGLSLPGLMLQDTWRFAFFAHGRGRAAFVNDLVWTVVQFPLMFLLIAAGQFSVLTATLAWGTAATVAALAGTFQAGTVPRPVRVANWLHAQRDLGSRFAGEVVVNTVSSQCLTYGIGAVAGLSAVGTIQAGRLLLSPLNLLFQAVNLTAVPEAVRQARVSSRHLVWFCAAFGLVLAGVTLAWTLVLLLIPGRLGETLLRDTWEPARSVVLPLALSQVAAGVTTGSAVGIRALAAAGRSLRATALTSFAGVIGSMAGVVRGGAVGAAWGGFVAEVFKVAVWWSSLALELRHNPIDPSQSESSCDPAGARASAASPAQDESLGTGPGSPAEPAASHELGLDRGEATPVVSVVISQDLPLDPEGSVLAAEASEFGPLVGGQTGDVAAVDLGLDDPALE
jgi:hypothetical protein